MNTNDPHSSKERKDFSKNEPKSAPFENNKNKSQDTRKTTEDFISYAKSNQEQVISYVLLAIGLLILLFVNNLLGGFIIGVVAGYFFAKEIIYYIRNIGQIAGGQDQLQYVILTAVLLGLFIAAPGIFIGAIIVAAFKNAMCGPCNTSKTGEDHTKPS